jgi:hypothetical protein
MIPVLAPPRSCTSLITAMLGQHPELYATAELSCFTADTLGGCLACNQRVQVVTTHGLLRSVAQLLCGEQTNATIATARQWLTERQHWSGAELVRWVEIQIAPKRLLEKSPIHVLRWESLQRLAAVTDAEPVLHLTRHPINAMVSLGKAYSRQGRTLSPGEALRVWVSGHANILRWIAASPSNGVLRVRCEDLLSNPESELERMATHLGVNSGAEAVAAMLHPENSAYACPGPSLAPSGNDTHWMASPALRRLPMRGEAERGQPAVNQLWDDPALPPELVMHAVQLAWDLGYS